MNQEIPNQTLITNASSSTPWDKFIAQMVELTLGAHQDKPDIVYQHTLSLEDAKKNNRLIYSDGSATEVAPLRAADNENPIHMGISANIPSTPGYFRLLTPMLGVRYLADGLTHTAFNLCAHEGGLLDKWVSTPINESINTIKNTVAQISEQAQIQGMTASDILDPTHFDQLTKHIDPENLQKSHNILASAGFPFRSEPKLRSFAEKHYIHQMMHSNPPDTIKTALSSENLSQSLKEVKSSLESNYNRTFFDGFLGSLSFLATWYYARRVYQDIHNTYAETVAYELYDETKPNIKISAVDLSCSKNKIVKETWDNFIGKNIARVATDIGFFGRNIAHGITKACEATGIEAHPLLHYAKNVRFGDIMLGVKSLMLVSETQRTHTSMLDDLQNLIDHKLNPQHGLGNPINAGDLLDLYQKYQQVHHPDDTLKDATRHDSGDKVEWRHALNIFSRMAEMMNQNYKYKHHYDPAKDPIEQINSQILAKHQYFSLPKFLFLLGHDLIDLKQPERTLALAEVANLYSIQRVKEIIQAEHEQPNVPFVDLLKHCPVNVTRTLGADTSPEFSALGTVNERVERGIIHTFLNNPEHHAINELYVAIAQHNHKDEHTTYENRASQIHKIQRLIDEANISTSGQILHADAQPALLTSNHEHLPLSSPDSLISQASREPMQQPIELSARISR